MTVVQAQARPGVLTRWWLWVLMGLVLVTGVLAYRSAATPVPPDPAITRSAAQPSS